jgi:aconitate hydratase
VESEPDFEVGDYLLVCGARSAVKDKTEKVTAYIIKPDGSKKEMTLCIPSMTDDERQIILDGCLINYYRG